MAIEVKRGKREIRDGGVVHFEVAGSDVGKTYDFAGILAGFRVTNVNVTVDEAFENTNNKISVGIEDDFEKFISATTVDGVKGIAFNNKMFTANKTESIVIDVTGDASATGKATVTLEYAKHASSRQEY